MSFAHWTWSELASVLSPRTLFSIWNFVRCVVTTHLTKFQIEISVRGLSTEARSEYVRLSESSWAHDLDLDQWGTNTRIWSNINLI